MLENFFGAENLSTLGVLAALTTIIVQFSKGLIPKKIPTKLVALVIGIALSLFFGLGLELSFASAVKSILTGCIVAFISMNGFDSLNEIWKRFKFKGGDE